MGILPGLPYIYIYISSHKDHTCARRMRSGDDYDDVGDDDDTEDDDDVDDG